MFYFWKLKTAKEARNEAQWDAIDSTTQNEIQYTWFSFERVQRFAELSIIKTRTSWLLANRWNGIKWTRTKSNLNDSKFY